MVERYVVNRRTLGLTKVYNHGKTQIPRDVRRILRIEDGDRVLWVLEDGKIVVKKII